MQNGFDNDNGMMGAARTGWNSRASYTSLVELGQQQFGNNSALGGTLPIPPPVQMVDPRYGEEDDVSSFDGSFYGTGVSRSGTKKSSSTGRRSKSSRNSSNSRSGMEPGGLVKSISNHHSSSRDVGKLPKQSRGDRRGKSSSRRTDHSSIVREDEDRRRGNRSSRSRSSSKRPTRTRSSRY